MQLKVHEIKGNPAQTPGPLLRCGGTRRRKHDIAPEHQVMRIGMRALSALPLCKRSAFGPTRHALGPVELPVSPVIHHW